jgi:glutathione S-transferase
MRLYYHPASTTCRMVMLFASEEGIDLDYKLVDLFTGEHLKPEFSNINASRLIPVLEDGDFRLSESSAILKYLADKTGSSAYPKDLKQRARVNEMMDWFNANFYKDYGYGLIYSQLFPHHKRPSDEIHAGTVAWGKEKSQGWFKILDEHLLGPQKPYLCGDKITLADYFGVEVVAVGDLIRCSYSAYPNVERWLRRMKGLKSWAKVHEAAEGFAASIKDTPFVAI